MSEKVPESYWISVLVADVRKFLDLGREEYHGAALPDGMLYRKACDAVDQLEPSAAALDARGAETRVCRSCGKPFMLDAKTREWFESRSMALPWRCLQCRRKAGGSR